MKQLIFIFICVLSFNLQAQDKQYDWTTDYNAALQLSEKQNKPVLVYVTKKDNCTPCKVIASEFLNTESFKNMSPNFVMLLIDPSNGNTYNKRIAMHITKQDKVPALAIIDAKGNLIGDALTEINKESIQTFMSHLNTLIE